MKRYLPTILFAAALLALACLTLSSCNTIAGAGRDVQNVGGAVTHAAS
jgi:predicted small secreted protein